MPPNDKIPDSTLEDDLKKIRKKILSTKDKIRQPSEDQAEIATRQRERELHETEIERLQRKAEVLKQKNDNQNIKLRGKMFFWVMCVVSAWLIFIIVFMSMLFLTGIDMKGQHHIVEPSIVITLLTTTTVNIIGLPLVITQSLFKTKK
ncbi:MAG: hypothetical protein ACRBCK_09970 [Alphaproteobacteria bacterium]